MSICSALCNQVPLVGHSISSPFLHRVGGGGWGGEWERDWEREREWEREKIEQWSGRQRQGE